MKLDKDYIKSLKEKTPLEPFLIQDPFGLRTAIVPVFRRKIYGEIYGMGTAFHVDGWGTFLTADHVIDFAREHPRSAKSLIDVSENSNGDRAILFLGMGLVCGTVNIPKEAFALVEKMVVALREKSNPMADLQGRIESGHLVDLASMTAIVEFDSEKIPKPDIIPVRTSGWYPSIGEKVLAIGFPELKCQRLDENSLVDLVEEGMYGAYGYIKDIHPNGTSPTNPTPVLEIECNWLSGMSGGPVFNSSGEVIGLVSRSLESGSDQPGIGYATYFGLVSNLGIFVPTLAGCTPGWRRGWAAIRKEPWHLAGFFKTEIEAQELANSMGDHYRIKYGCGKFGTDEFICQGL